MKESTNGVDVEGLVVVVIVVVLDDSADGINETLHEEGDIVGISGNGITGREGGLYFFHQFSIHSFIHHHHVIRGLEYGTQKKKKKNRREERREYLERRTARSGGEHVLNGVCCILHHRIARGVKSITNGDKISGKVLNNVRLIA